MSSRLQTVNGDTVLEVTTTQAVKVRHSENALLSQKARLEAAITKFKAELDDTNAKLALINNERQKASI